MPLRSAGVTLLHHYYGLLPHPFSSHFLLLSGIGMRIPWHPLGWFTCTASPILACSLRLHL